MRSTGIVWHPIAAGELRDRVFGLAARAGVPLRQLYYFETSHLATGNAFAIGAGYVALTDRPLGSLDRLETDAVVAHELSHLKHHHPRWLRLAFSAAIGVPIGVGLATAEYIRRSTLALPLHFVLAAPSIGL